MLSDITQTFAIQKVRLIIIDINYYIITLLIQPLATLLFGLKLRMKKLKRSWADKSGHITSLPWRIYFIHQRGPLFYLLCFTRNCNNLGYLGAKLKIRDTKLEAVEYDAVFKLLCFFILIWGQDYWF